MTKTKIEWADEVWNPVTGCVKISEGCRHCYAERIAARFWKDRKFTDVQIHEDRLSEPMRWKRPRRVFVNSMSDLFHPMVPVDFIANVFAVMALARQHTYMVLTKRAARMYDVLASNSFVQEYKDCIEILSEGSINGVFYPLDNVWLGVSAETQKEADQRIPILLQMPAVRRFASIEPMLGPISLQGYDGKLSRNFLDPHYMGERWKRGPLDWVIVGGESGPGSRPMHPDWVRMLRDQCTISGVPFFFKQWGEWWPGHPQYGDTDSVIRYEDEAENAKYGTNDEICLENTGNYAVIINDRDVVSGSQPNPELNPWWMLKVGKKQAGRELDGRIWDQYWINPELYQSRDSHEL